MYVCITNNKTPSVSGDIHPSTHETGLPTRPSTNNTRLLHKAATNTPAYYPHPLFRSRMWGFLRFFCRGYKKLGGLGIRIPPAAGGVTYPSNPCTPRPHGSAPSAKLHFILFILKSHSTENDQCRSRHVCWRSNKSIDYSHPHKCELSLSIDGL